MNRYDCADQDCSSDHLLDNLAFLPSTFVLDPSLNETWTATIPLGHLIAPDYDVSYADH